jgi:uncharacterized protein
MAAAREPTAESDELAQPRMIGFAPMSSQKHQLAFRRLLGRFAVCRLPAGTGVPGWGFAGLFASVTRSQEEVSIVCAEENVPAEVKAERGWAGFQLEGPFPFSMTGVLSAFIEPLAQRGISIFAVSTFDTDYVFVKEGCVGPAMLALRRAGHRLIED